MIAEFLNIVALERKRYVEFFLQETNNLRKEKYTCATELLIEINDETVAPPFNISYLDFIYKDREGNYQISELRLDKNLSYKCLCFHLDKLKVQLNPFCWNSCEFTVDKIEMSALANWVTKWLKIGEEIPDIDPGEVIHSCSEPSLIGARYSFTIDFGTAPETCFIEFLQLLQGNNVEEVLIETSEV